MAANIYDLTPSNHFICWKLNVLDTSTYSSPALADMSLAMFYNIDGGLYSGEYAITPSQPPDINTTELTETSTINYVFHWVVEWTATTFNVNDIVFYLNKMWYASTPTIAGETPGTDPKWVEVNPNDAGKGTFDSANNLIETIAEVWINACTWPLYVEQECSCWRVELTDYMTDETYEDSSGVFVNWNWAVAVINGSTITPIQFVDRNGGTPSATLVEFCLPESYEGEGTIRTIYTQEQTIDACDFTANEFPYFEQIVDSDYAVVNFSLQAAGDCTSVVVTDNTDWSASTLDRDEVGIALFSSQDGLNWTGDLTNPGSNTVPAVWYVDAQNQNSLYITSFFVPVWSAGTYVAGSIVLHLGTFYFNGTGASTTGIPGTSTDWDVLTVNDYGTFYNSVFNMGLDYWMYNTQIALDCDLTQIWKLSCYNYRIVPNMEDITIVQGGVTYNRNWEVTLYDYTGQTALGCWVIDRNAGDTYVDITTPELDGVYIVTIRYQAGAIDGNTCNNVEDDLQIAYSYPIYEICSLNKCYMSLVQSILCNEMDPCCETCDEDVIRAMELQRLEINKMVMLYFTLLAYLNLERVNYLGVDTFYDFNGNPVNMDRYNLVMQIKDIITKIGEVVGRCGDCNGTQQDTPNPCKDC